jgi:DNA-directed RNA polymerase specialized sigma24 family protein
MRESPNPKASKLTLNRKERGRRSYKEGYSFEDRVAELYRLLHYRVEHGRIFSGRQVDLFITRQIGDFTLQRAIECKATAVKAEHMDSFVAKLHLVRREYPSAQGTIVSGLSFTDAITAQAVQEGIQLTLYRDLAAQLLDGQAYATSLIRECESNERYPMNMYVEPLIGYEAKGLAAASLEIISEWLDESEWNQLTLLGDVGTGKSFLSRIVAYRLAKRFLEKPLERPLPILVDLRNADRQFSLEGLILTHFAKTGLAHVTFEVFQHVLLQGNIVLILDGFDEMAARVTPQVTNRNFHELARCVKGRAKVLLTCRTHYFKSRTEEEEVILGSMEDYGSETARDLYWELIARKGFRIAYLRPFETSQVEEYVRRAKPDSAKEALTKIRNTYNLMELSQRPMLLEMIVKSIDALTAKEINAATLYKVFTDAWIHRDQWRDVLSPEAKLSFLMALARSLWDEDALNMHYTRLTEYLQQELATQIQNLQQLVEIDSEIRTASFLTRDDSGHYGFAHKSYGEFFFARYLAYQLKKGYCDCLHTRRLSPEIVSFLRNMIKPAEIERHLENTLTQEYRPFVSENALICLYGFRRSVLLRKHSPEELIVPLPSNANLKGAQLDQITLEGAVLTNADLSGANLTEAILVRADLSNAGMEAAILEKADLTRTVLRSATMQGATLIGANLQSATLSGANLRGANLSDVYLLHAAWDGVDFRDAVFSGAVLPDELRAAVGQYVDDEQFRRNLEADNSSITDEYWKMIENLRPRMVYLARIASFARGPDPEDIVSELIIRLASPRNLERLMKLEEPERMRFVSGEINAMVRPGVQRNLPLFSDFEETEVDESDFEDSELDDALEETTDQDNAVVESPELAQYVESFVSSNPGPFEQALISDIRRVLSDRFWEIIEARYIYGYSLQEIALNQKQPLRDIKIQLRKAHEVLRKYLAPPTV